MSRLPERIDALLAHVSRAHGGSFRLAGRYFHGPAEVARWLARAQELLAM
jgi:hypothetical protein